MLRTVLRQTALCLPLLAIGVTATAQQSTSAEQTTESSRGNITGTVTGDRGQPLAGANVVVSPLNVIGGSATRQITTNNEGSFEAINLPHGLYSIFVTAPVYVLPPRDLETPAPVYRPGDSVRLELIRGGVITGTVTNALNEPVVSIRVTALMVRDALGNASKGLLRPFGNVSTDDRGVYRMYGLVPGTYIVQVGGPGLTGGSGNIIPYDLDGPTYAPSSTRDDAMEITVASGQESTIDIRYRAEPGHVVSGTVKNIGNTVSNVSLVPANGGWMTSSVIFQRPGDRGFAFYGVPDGVYDVLAQQSTNVPGGPPEMSVSEGRRITVKGADVSGIELVTKPLGSITGAVVLQPSTAPECAGKRRPVLAETMLTAQRNGGAREDSVPLSLKRTAASAVPDKDGAITFRNLVNGEYAIVPRFFSRFWYLQSITHTTVGAASAKAALSNQKIDVAKNWINVKSGDRLTGLSVTLSEGAGSVRGRLVMREDSKPPESLNVIFVPAEREKSGDVLRYFAVDIAPDKTFIADNLPPGRYWITTHPRLAKETTGNNLRMPDGAQQRSKLLGMAETSNVMIEIKPCQSISDYQLRDVSR